MKKRFAVTLNEETVERFKAIAKELRLPPSIMSGLCEEAIAQTTVMLETAKEKGRLSLSDVFAMMAQNADAFEEEVKLHDQSRKAAPGRKASVKHSDKRRS